MKNLARVEIQTEREREGEGGRDIQRGSSGVELH